MEGRRRKRRMLKSEKREQARREDPVRIRPETNKHTKYI